MNAPIAFEISQEEQSKSEIYYSTMKYFARITQFLAWPFTFAFFYIFFNLKIHGRENLSKVSSPVIIISNHISAYDSFVFRLVLGFAGRKLPLRFMAVNKFSIWYLNLLTRLYIVDIIYALFGVFVIHEGRGIDKNLQDAIRIVKNGGNVVIYPEGRIIRSGKVGDFRLGAAVLAQKTQAPVIPISMKIEDAFFGNKFIVTVGEPMEVNTAMSAQQITDIFHKRISTMYGGE